MFRIEKAFSKGPNGDDLMVVDHDRGVWLQRVAGKGPEPGDVHKLVWGDRAIPFEVLTDEHEDPATGQTFYLTRFTTFGQSGTSAVQGGPGRYAFRSDEERRAAQLLAVEALLMFSSLYNGDKRPEGYDRVEFEGRLYTKKDFGMS